MRKLYFLFLVISSCVNAQNDNVCLNFLTEKVLIRNVEYPISISKNKIILHGNGISIQKTIDKSNSYIIKANYAEKYYIDFLKVKKKDTVFLKREYFQVISMPKPVFEWGNFDSFHDEYSISKDSLLNQKSIKLVSGWSDLGKHQWKIVGGELSFNKKNYRIEDSRISDSILKEIASLKGKNNVKFIFTYVGPDGIRRKFSQEKVIEIVPNSQSKEQLNIEKKYDSEPDFHVVNIDASKFLGKDYSDTVKIIGVPKIFLRFTAPGTENNYTIFDYDHKELFNIVLWSNDEAKLIDFSNYVGEFEIELRGDGGFGKIILFIE